MIITAITYNGFHDAQTNSVGGQYPVVKWQYQFQTNDRPLEKYRNNLQRVTELVKN